MISEHTGACRLLGVLRRVPRALHRIAPGMVATSVGLPLAFAIALCPAQAQDTIKIGVPAPLSGSYQNAGTDVVDGARLAVEQINAAGGVRGRMLELVPQDDACDPDVAAKATTQLVATGVVAVAGGYCSSAALPELRVLHDRHIPYVLDASTIPQLTDHGWPDVFRTIGRTDAQGTLSASLMEGVLHAKRAAVMNDGSTYSQVLAESAVAALKRDGVEVVYDDAITPGLSDYRDIVHAVGNLKPDVLYFTGYYTEAAALAKALRELAPSIKHFMGNGTADPSLIQKGGDAVEGMIVTTSPLPQFMDGPRARRFVKAYQAAYQRDAGPYSVYEYDAIGVTARAIQNAKSIVPEDIAVALHALKRYSGATGEIAFDWKGDRTKAAYMAVIVRGGKFEPYARLDAKEQWVVPK